MTFKSIEELTTEAEDLKTLVDYYRRDANELRNEALKSDGLAITLQYELDDIERQLISANGEAS